MTTRSRGVRTGRGRHHGPVAAEPELEQELREIEQELARLREELESIKADADDRRQLEDAGATTGLLEEQLTLIQILEERRAEVLERMAGMTGGSAKGERPGNEQR
jgi:hypothetical protein